MNGTTPQVTTRQQETILCRLPIWEDDETTLEGQGRQQECNKSSNIARSDCGRRTPSHICIVAV